MHQAHAAVIAQGVEVVVLVCRSGGDEVLVDVALVLVGCADAEGFDDWVSNDVLLIEETGLHTQVELAPVGIASVPRHLVHAVLLPGRIGHVDGVRVVHVDEGAILQASPHMVLMVVLELSGIAATSPNVALILRGRVELQLVRHWVTTIHHPQPTLQLALNWCHLSSMVI